MDEELEVIPPPPQEPCHSTNTPPTDQQQQNNNQQRKNTKTRLAKIATIIGAAVVGGGGGSNLNEVNNGETLEGWNQRELEDNFIGLRIKEADTLAELKEMRQKVFIFFGKFCSTSLVYTSHIRVLLIEFSFNFQKKNFF